MGERKIKGEAMRVRTPRGMVEVRWDERCAATALADVLGMWMLSNQDAVLVGGSFVAVRCHRQVQGDVIESARTRP